MHEGPVRTCIGCRVASAAGELRRLVLRAGKIVVLSPRAPSSGRGAWIHPREACVTDAIARRVLARAFRVPAVNPEQIGALLGTWEER